MGGDEIQFVKEAFESNYVAPLGPQVDAFEAEFSRYAGLGYCVAVSSGTAAIHLALRELGVVPGDEVIASSLTFIGSVTPIVYQGAIPVFIDSERGSWNMDPDLLDEELERCNKKGKLPKAVIPTDLYGQCADYGRIFGICEQYGVPVVADSAEALGAQYKWSVVSGQWSDSGMDKDAKEAPEEFVSEVIEAKGLDEKSEIGNRKSEISRHAGKGARAAVFSFNGNKIITTSGGGMLASDDEALIEKARFLSQQARDAAPHYEHSQIGYNYRMSNVLAAIGRGQLRVLDERVQRKRAIFDYYHEALGDLPGIEFMPEASYGISNRWLTVVLITPKEFGTDRETIRLALEKENIEARPVWKPMHMQPVFEVSHRDTPVPSSGATGQGGRRTVDGGQRTEDRGRKTGNLMYGCLDGDKRRYRARMVGGEVTEDLFGRGLCLPSGTAMTNGELDRVISVILKCHKG